MITHKIIWVARLLLYYPFYSSIDFFLRAYSSIDVVSCSCISIFLILI